MNRINAALKEVREASHDVYFQEGGPPLLVSAMGITLARIEFEVETFLYRPEEKRDPLVVALRTLRSLLEVWPASEAGLALLDAVDEALEALREEPEAQA